MTEGPTREDYADFWNQWASRFPEGSTVEGGEFYVVNGEVIIDTRPEGQS